MAVISSSTSSVISLPFSFSYVGAVNRVEYGSTKYWNDRILSLLLTGDYERVGYQYYGASIQNLLFQDVDSFITLAAEATEQMFGRWLPELKYVQLSGKYDYNAGTVTLTIYYKTPDGTDESVKINTASLTPAGELVKVY